MGWLVNGGSNIDYRSDFYSLGATFYELFSGRKPFQSGDPMTLLHAQIATVPTPLHEITNAAIPQALSDLVQRLLAKRPDDRYQSSFGLLTDLEACAERWRLYRRIEGIELGAADVPERFCVAQKLYGREAECAAILEAFERISVGAVELLLISGYSGIGKTALVSELHRPVLARSGYFVRGKCDQYNRNQPFAALIQAFQLLVRQLAVEGSERRQYWKTRLDGALGANAAAVVELIPELALLIGSPPPLPSLPAAERATIPHRFWPVRARLVGARTSAAGISGRSAVGRSADAAPAGTPGTLRQRMQRADRRRLSRQRGQRWRCTEPDAGQDRGGARPYRQPETGAAE